MSRITELPDDFDASLDLNKGPDPDASIEDLYYQQFAKDGFTPAKDSTKSFEETMAEFSKTPLFMSNLDAAGDAEGENNLLDAIRALQYEGSQSEIALGFKNQGNEMVASKTWVDAKEFYTKGLAVLNDKSVDKWEKPIDPDADAKFVLQLREQLFVNRALANLELKNYRSTLNDSAATLTLNPTNIKAHYRSALALLALDKPHEALDTVSRGLTLDPSNTPLQSLLTKSRAHVATKNAQDAAKRTALARSRREKATLYAALKSRAITLRSTPHPPETEDAQIHLSPDPLSPTSTLIFPLLLLYPLAAQSDLIKTVGENDPLVDHLSYILPAPWDTQGEYTLDGVDCYMDTATRGLVKVGKKKTLLEALAGGRTEVVDGLVRMHVVPTKRAAGWIEEVKRKKKKKTQGET